LKFIDWEELEDKKIEQIESLSDELGMDGSVIEGSFCKVWTRPDDTILSHTLYLTEDLYAHHIVDGYSYPGLHLGDQIVFRCRRLEETCFCEELRQFWTDWVSRSLQPWHRR
jgi:hypothetical protein